MSDKLAMRGWKLTIDGDNDRYQTVKAAYYSVDPKSELIEFKDTAHSVVMAVPSSRVVLIVGENTDGAVVEVALNPDFPKDCVNEAIRATMLRQP